MTPYNNFQINFITSQVNVERKKSVLSSEDIILFFTKLIWLLKLSYFVIQSDLKTDKMKICTKIAHCSLHIILQILVKKIIPIQVCGRNNDG